MGVWAEWRCSADLHFKTARAYETFTGFSHPNGCAYQRWVFLLFVYFNFCIYLNEKKTVAYFRYFSLCTVQGCNNALITRLIQLPTITDTRCLSDWTWNEGPMDRCYTLSMSKKKGFLRNWEFFRILHFPQNLTLLCLRKVTLEFERTDYRYLFLYFYNFEDVF